jgi:hypothetical protein
LAADGQVKLSGEISDAGGTETNFIASPPTVQLGKVAK